MRASQAGKERSRTSTTDATTTRDAYSSLLDGVCNWIFGGLIFSTPGTASAAASPPPSRRASSLLCFLFGYVTFFRSFPVCYKAFILLVRMLSFTHQLTISRLNWHIRNLRARQLRTHLLGRIFSSDWPLFSRNSNPLPATIVSQKRFLQSPSLRHQGFYRTPKKRLHCIIIVYPTPKTPKTPNDMVQVPPLNIFSSEHYF